MPFQFQNTDIKNLILIKPHIASDNRGFYKKYYEQNIFLENNLPTHFMESSVIMSSQGVLRGLHFQIKKPQGKLIQVLNGEIFDVALDLRKDSATFGKWKSFYLNHKESTMLYIPEGFAHGFLSLEENTLISYQSTNVYFPNYSNGIKWDDLDLNIPWPLHKISQLILSDKDKDLNSLSEFKSFYKGL